MRAINSNQKPGARPATSVPRENSDIASRKTVRVRCVRAGSRWSGSPRPWSAGTRSSTIEQCCRDAEVDHQPRQGHGHDRLVENHHKAATSSVAMMVRA